MAAILSRRWMRLLGEARFAAAAPAAKGGKQAVKAVQGPPKDPNTLFVPERGVNRAYDVLSDWWAARREAGARELEALKDKTGPEADQRRTELAAWLQRTDPLREQRARFKRLEKPRVYKPSEITNAVFAELGLAGKTVEQLKQMGLDTCHLYHPASLSLRVHPLVAFSGGRLMSDSSRDLAPMHTLDEPRVTFEGIPAFSHYTVALVDPDCPDEVKRTFVHRYHWLVTDIPVDDKGRADVSKGKEVVPYTQILAEKGSLDHRVVFAVYGQPRAQLDAAAPQPGQTLVGFADAAGLELVGIVARSFEWDDSVTDYYADQGRDEPLFGSAQKIVLPKFQYVQRPAQTTTQ